MAGNLSQNGLDFVIADMQAHLKNAKIDLNNLSTMAKRGDERLVEQFLSESMSMSGGKDRKDLLHSQLYLASFWGFKESTQKLLEHAPGLVNEQNPKTLWTPLHAATFQEHGPVVMLLLENKADPKLADSAGRTAKDFASASDKVWPHFAARGLSRTPRNILMQMGIVGSRPQSTSRTRSLPMAEYLNHHGNPDESGDNSYMSSTCGDVLANDRSESDHKPKTGSWWHNNT